MVASALVAALSVLVIGLIPAALDREAPPAPQNASHYLRDPATPPLDIELDQGHGLGGGPGDGTASPAGNAADADDPAGPPAPVEPDPTTPKAVFLRSVDPRTFLTPYADSVLIENPGWICDAPAPPDAIHVATDGDDGNPGTGARPLASITEAVRRAQPGQHVLVHQGRYEEQVVISGISGRPDAWITLRSHPGERATIAPDIGQFAVAYRKGSSYHNVACLELAGPIGRPEAVPSSPTIMRERRLAGDGATEIPQNYGAGVDVGDRADTREGFLSHHVRVLANEVHDFAEQGISAVEASHITVVGNVVYRNALYGCHSGSGIGLAYMVDSGGPDNADGYTNYIVGNVSFANENRSLQCFSDSLGAVLTDGNGIILDDNDTNDYQGRTLVADNVVYGNGGRGILVFNSSRIDVVNNISYHNVFTDELFGSEGPHPEVAVADATEVRIYNNIAIPRAGHVAYEDEASDVDARANRFTEPGPAVDLFLDPGTDATSDFTIRAAAEAGLGGGVAFLMTVEPGGEPSVVTPAAIGAIYNAGLTHRE